MTHAELEELDAAITVLGNVLTAPGIGENLKSAAKLLSKICERMQVRSNSLSHADHV
jgi:hypothetical protein